MARFLVCFQRPQGEARSYPLGRDDALKFADQIAGEEEGIMIKDPETGDRWTVEQFRAAR